jgi:hypothetical protein
MAPKFVVFLQIKLRTMKVENWKLKYAITVEE